MPSNHGESLVQGGYDNYVQFVNNLAITEMPKSGPQHLSQTNIGSVTHSEHRGLERLVMYIV
jgi:hypothetical protein